MKRLFLLLFAAVWIPAALSAQKTYHPSLEGEFICDVNDWTPADVALSGSAQGFAIHGRYCVLVRDKGMCSIYDMKKKALVANYMLEGNESHCNNAAFGKEKWSRDSMFPLLYISECRGGHACFVTDLSLSGGKIVQKIYFDGTGYPGSFDWALDVKNGFIYTYGGRNGDFKLLKKFRLPRLSDSDANGEVHLTDADVLDETRIESGINIWQGSYVRGRYAYLPDGYPPHDRLIHIVDLDTKRIIATKNVNDLEVEPEGCDIKGKWLYVAFHTPKKPRHSKIYRFKIK